MKRLIENDFNDQLSFIIITISKLALVSVVAIYCWYYFGATTTNRGSSMKETLSDQDIVLIDKLSYSLFEPDRFDVIAFSRSDDTTGIKRIVGLPGETVTIIDGVIMIDGQQVSCDYIGAISTPGIAQSPVVVPEGSYFVLSDNPSFGEDSRYTDFGFVDGETIIGKVWFCIYPIPDLGIVR
ncbi:MAG: signal peptidase I [Lachnospiraceae bacterium]|nr:signal peptidase I [Lachnospiraceae bacterium]